MFRSSEAAADGNRLTIVARSYGTAIVPSLRAGAMPRPIALRLGAIVSGVVLRSDRKTPAAGALVRFETAGLETPWIEAGADGRFELTDLPARAGAIVSEGGDAGLGEAATGPLPAPAGRVVTVVLSTPATLEGLVVDTRTRAPVPRVRISAEDGRRTRDGAQRPGRPLSDPRAPPAAAVPLACGRAALHALRPRSRPAHDRGDAARATCP